MDADLVLEGGGVKGIGLVGAFSALSDAGYEVRRVAGTSAGAIVGALIAAGMSAEELEEAMREVDYRRFQDKGLLDRLLLPGQVLSLLFEQGIYEGSYLRGWLTERLAELGVRTFADLRIDDDPGSSLPPKRSYRLVVMASDVTRGRLVRLPWDYPMYGLDPDEQSVADAVRASMSIPFFYEPLRLRSTGPDGRQDTSYLVDGGMLSNFPIDVFDRTDGKAPRWPTIGIKLSSKPDAALRHKYEVHGTASLAIAMVGTMTSFHDQIHIDDPATVARTIFVDTFGVRATDFDIGETMQDTLFRSGVEAAEAFLEDWDFGRYLERFPPGAPELPD